MRDPSDHPDYSGLLEEFLPTSGAAGEFNSRIRNRTPDEIRNFHNIDRLMLFLDNIDKESANVIEIAEKELTNYNLLVNPLDLKMVQAQEQEWPYQVGEMENRVSFVQYKAMAARNTRSADYIKKVYEKEIRTAAGTTAFDVLSLATLIRFEGQRIKTFINDYIGEVDDEAEFRILEAFQIWAQTALGNTRVLGEILQEGAIPDSLTEAELGRLSPEEAADYQAVLQVRLNSINQQLVLVEDDLKKHYFDHSPTFYVKHLGPALKFRLGPSRGVRPTVAQGALYREVRDVVGPLDTTLKVLIADQIKRNETYTIQTGDYYATLKTRDKIAGWIRQLSGVGAPLPEKFDNQFQITPEQARTFAEIASTDLKPGRFDFISSIYELGDSLDARFVNHLLKDGDTLEGDLDVAEGVKIAGLDVAQHTHDGIGGGPRLTGDSIDDGTIQTDVIDTSDTPEIPENLVVTDVEIAIQPPGTPVANVTVAWDNAYANLTYEVQITEE